MGEAARLAHTSEVPEGLGAEVTVVSPFGRALGWYELTFLISSPKHWLC